MKLKLVGLFAVLLILLNQHSFGMASPMDCIGAIPLCHEYYVEPTPFAYDGEGNYPNEIYDVFYEDCILYEDNGIWYIFTAQTSGNFRFTIEPHDNSDNTDYDWAVFDATNKTCSEVTQNPVTYYVSANNYGNPGHDGKTGANSAYTGGYAGNCNGPGDENGPIWNDDIPVFQGHTYLLYVSNWSETDYGFNIDFSASDAVIIDNINPEYLYITAPNYGSNMINLTFSENISCSSIEDDDFVINGPDGIHQIVSITSDNCGLGGNFDNNFNIICYPSFTVPGEYSLELIPEASGSVEDVCSNLAEYFIYNFEICATPPIEFEITPPACHDSEAIITYNGEPVPNAYFIWNFGTGTVSSGNTNGPGPVNVNYPNANTTYAVSLETRIAGCRPSYLTETIYVPPAMSTNASATTDYCDLCIGTAEVNAEGGSENYTYSWSHDSNITSNSIDNLCADNYVVSVTDDYGCVRERTISVLRENGLQINSTQEDIKCFGENTGNIAIEVTNNREPYEVLWNNGAVTEEINDLYHGTYTVTVTSTDGCSDEQTIIIAEPPQLILSLNGTDIDCYGNSSGQIIPQISGGTLPYSYLWNNNDLTQELHNLQFGSYALTITDGNQCSVESEIYLQQPDSLYATYVTTHNFCFGDANGSIQLNTFGGTPPYNFIWNNDSFSSDIYNLPSGLYEVTIADNNSCQNVRNIEIRDSLQEIVINSEIQQITCHDNNDGSIILNVEPTTNTYSFSWSNSHHQNILQNLSEGIYTITVTDQHNCYTIDSFQIINPDSLLVSISDVLMVCPQKKFCIVSNPTGGTEPYQYFWNNNLADKIFCDSIVSATIYEHFITDANNCTSATQFSTVDVYDSPVLDIDLNDNEICEGTATIVNAKFNGGAGEPYVFYINEDIIDSLPWQYLFSESTHLDFTLFDACNTEVTSSANIIVNPLPMANFEPSPYETTILEPAIDFYNYSENALSYIWHFGDDQYSDEYNPTHHYEVSGLYNCQLVAFNEYGCTDTALHEIKITEPILLYAPTAFNPDGDGDNDYFTVFGNGIDESNFELFIYDRWGQMMHKTHQFNSVTQGWDGKSSTGKNVPMGVYTWLAVYKDIYGRSYEERGSFTLIR
jgi:gliding motility-associated-like protein